MKTSFFFSLSAAESGAVSACLFPEIKDDRGICFYDVFKRKERWILSSDYLWLWFGIYMTHDVTAAVLDA